MNAKPWKSPRFGKAVKGLDARYHKVERLYNDGEYAVIQFVREDGEIVVGEFKLMGWSWAPSKERAELVEMLSSPPLVFARGGKSG